MASTSAVYSQEALEAVASSWRGFGLDARRAALDESALSIASAQEAGARSRKRLGESVKAFKQQLRQQQQQQQQDKAGDDEGGAAAAAGGGGGRGEAGGGGKAATTLRILRSFQQEVDELTRRARAAEAAFMGVYRDVFELPDAAPYLESAQMAQAQLESLRTTHAATAAELEEYREESATIRNQTLTVRKLEEKVRALENELVDREMEADGLRRQLESMPIAEVEAGAAGFDDEAAKAFMDATGDDMNAEAQAGGGKDASAPSTPSGKVPASDMGLDQLVATRQELEAMRREYFKVDKKLLAVRVSVCARTKMGASPDAAIDWRRRMSRRMRLAIWRHPVITIEFLP